MYLFIKNILLHKTKKTVKINDVMLNEINSNCQFQKKNILLIKVTFDNLILKHKI